MQFLHDPTHLPACEASLGYRDLAAVYQEVCGQKGPLPTVGKEDLGHFLRVINFAEMMAPDAEFEG